MGLRYHSGSVTPESERHPGICRQRCPTENSVNLASLVDLLREEISSTSEDFRSSGFLAQVWVSYTAMQPWMKLGQVSIRMSAFLRALLLTAKVVGALMLSAFFFQFSGEAMAIKSADECRVKSLAGRIWRNIFVGLLSAALSAFPLLVIYRLQRRNFIYQESWVDAKKRRSYLRRWSMLSALATALGLGYCSVCSLIIVSFLANIDPSMEAQWLISAAAALLREFLLVPLALAVVYVAAIEMISRRRPHLIDRVYRRFGVSRSELEATPKSEGSRGAKRGPDSLSSLLVAATASNESHCQPDAQRGPESMALRFPADVCEPNPQRSLRSITSTPWQAPCSFGIAHVTPHDACVVDVIQLDEKPDRRPANSSHAAPVGDGEEWLDHSPPERGIPVPPYIGSPFEPEAEPPVLPSPFWCTLPGTPLHWEIEV